MTFCCSGWASRYWSESTPMAHFWVPAAVASTAASMVP